MKTARFKDSGTNCTDNFSRFRVMIKNISIGFLLAILLLIVSEYFFLQELYTRKRIGIIVFTAAGLVAGAALFLFFYKRFRKGSG